MIKMSASGFISLIMAPCVFNWLNFGYKQSTILDNKIKSLCDLTITCEGGRATGVWEEGEGGGWRGSKEELHGARAKSIWKNKDDDKSLKVKIKQNK